MVSEPVIKQSVTKRTTSDAAISEETLANDAPTYTFVRKNLTVSIAASSRLLVASTEETMTRVLLGTNRHRRRMRYS